MATEDQLHDLVDNLEGIQVEAAEQLRELFSSIDVERLADPNDTAFNLELEAAILAIIGESMAGSHAEGRDFVADVFGITGAVLTTPLLIAAAAVIEQRVGFTLERFRLRVFEFIATSGARGLSPLQALDSLERSLFNIGDSRIPGNANLVVELRTIISGVMLDGVSTANRTGITEQILGPEIDELTPAQAQELAGDVIVRWVCTLVNTCPDCIVRHLATATLNEWIAVGEPGTGWSICQDRCRCVLVPADGSGDLMPLQRRRTTTSGLTVRVPREVVEGIDADAERRLAVEQRIRDTVASRIEARRGLRELGNQAADEREGRDPRVFQSPNEDDSED